MINSVESPVIDAEKPLAVWEKNRASFDAMFNELLKSYEGQFVAIHDNEVVASGADKQIVFDAARSKCSKFPFYIRLVSRAPKIVRVPSVWRVRKT
jgi:hypothetical protein